MRLVLVHAMSRNSSRWLAATMKPRNGITPVFCFLLVVLSSFLFLNSPGTHDVTSWLDEWWMPNYKKFGFFRGYSSTGDNYPPLSFVVIGAIGELSTMLNIAPLTVFILFISLFLMSTTMVYYHFTKNIALAGLLHASLAINSMALGYLDVLFAPFVVLSLFALKSRRHLLFTTAFVLGILMKYQPLAILPFLLVYVANVRSLADVRKIDLRDILQNVFLPSGIMLGIAIGAFGRHSIISLLKATQHTSISANALNFNWVVGSIIKMCEPARYENVWQINYTQYPITLFSMVVFLALYLFALFHFFKDKEKTFDRLLLHSALGYLSYFVFGVGVHENYLFLPCLLFVMLLHEDNGYAAQCTFWLMYANLNLLMFYGIEGKGLHFNHKIFGFDYLGILVSILGVIMFLRFYVERLSRTRPKHRSYRSSVQGD